ncbi:MAG: hypothetical protein ABSA52_04905 [Candidatus Binatia bacterium]
MPRDQGFTPLLIAVDEIDEERPARLMQGGNEGKLGGVDLQLCGREAGIRRWTERVFGGDAVRRMEVIFAAGQNKGPFGRCIAGGVDLDNLDNLTRVAFHMGLDVDRQLPVRVAETLVGNSEADGITFSSDAVGLIEGWLALRTKVYSHLMLSREDFAGKTMLIYATVAAFKRGHLEPCQLVWQARTSHLRGMESARVESRDTVQLGRKHDHEHQRENQDPG